MGTNISGGNSFIYLGKNTKNDRKLNAEDMKGGIKRENIVKNNNLNDAQKARMLQIFDAIDKNGGQADGILDAEEIRGFWELLTTAAGDEKLNGKNEINTVATALGFNQNDLTQEELFQFIGDIANQMEDIESSTINENGTIIVTHKKGENDAQVTEKFLEDGSKIVETKYSTGTVSSYNLDKNGILKYEKEVTTENGVEKISYIYYDEEGKKPVKKCENVGTEQKTYEYRNGSPVLTQITQQLSDDIYKTIDITYTEDGLKQTITQDGQPVIHERYQNIQTPSGKSTLLLTERVTDGEPKKTEHWDYENGTKTELLTESETGNNTKNEYVMVLNEAGEIEYKQTYQEYLDISINTKYMVSYDANGNTMNVIAQRNETPAQIAEKYGCDLNELLEANKSVLNSKGGFDPATSIVIPRKIGAKEFAALDANRKTASTIRREIHNEEVQAARRRNAQEEANNRVMIEDYNLADWTDRKFYNPDIPKYREAYKKINSNHLKMITGYLFKLEGYTDITEIQSQVRMNQIRQDNPDMFDDDGFLKMGSDTIWSRKYKLNLHLDPTYAQNINLARDTAAEERTQRLQEKSTTSASKVALESWRILNDYVTPAPLSLNGGEHWSRRSLFDAINGKLDSKSIASFFESYSSNSGGRAKFVTELSNSPQKSLKKTIVTFMLDQLKERCQELGLNNATAQQLKQLSWNSDPAQLDRVINAVAFDIRKLETVPESRRPAMLEEMSGTINERDLNNFNNIATRTNQEVGQAEKYLEDNPRDLFERLYDFFSSEDDQVNGAISQFKAKYQAIQTAYKNSGENMAVFEAEFKRQFGHELSEITESLKQFSSLTNQKGFIAIYNNARNMASPNNQIDNRTKEQLIEDIMDYSQEDILRQMLGLENANGIKAKLQTLDKATLQAFITEYVTVTHDLCGGRTSDAGIDNQLENLYKDIMGSDSDILKQTFKYVANRKGFSNACVSGIKIVVAVACSVTGVGAVGGAVIVGGTSMALSGFNHMSQNADANGGTWNITWAQMGDAALEGLVDGGLYYIGGTYGKGLNALQHPLEHSTRTFYGNIAKTAIVNGSAATIGDGIKNGYDIYVMGEDKPLITAQGVATNFLIAGAASYVDKVDFKVFDGKIDNMFKNISSNSPKWLQNIGQFTGVAYIGKGIQYLDRAGVLDDLAKETAQEFSQEQLKGENDLTVLNNATEVSINTPMNFGDPDFNEYAIEAAADSIYIPDYQFTNQNIVAAMLPQTSDQLVQFRVIYGSGLQ